MSPAGLYGIDVVTACGWQCARRLLAQRGAPFLTRPGPPQGRGACGLPLPGVPQRALRCWHWRALRVRRPTACPGGQAPCGTSGGAARACVARAPAPRPGPDPQPPRIVPDAAWVVSPPVRGIPGSSAWAPDRARVEQASASTREQLAGHAPSRTLSWSLKRPLDRLKTLHIDPIGWQRIEVHPESSPRASEAVDRRSTDQQNRGPGGRGTAKGGSGAARFPESGTRVGVCCEPAGPCAPLRRSSACAS